MNVKVSKIYNGLIELFHTLAPEHQIQFINEVIDQPKRGRPKKTNTDIIEQKPLGRPRKVYEEKDYIKFVQNPKSVIFITNIPKKDKNGKIMTPKEYNKKNEKANIEYYKQQNEIFKDMGIWNHPSLRQFDETYIQHTVDLYEYLTFYDLQFILLNKPHVEDLELMNEARKENDYNIYDEDTKYVKEWKNQANL